MAAVVMGLKELGKRENVQKLAQGQIMSKVGFFPPLSNEGGIEIYQFSNGKLESKILL